MNAFHIKLLAIVTMFIDHIGLFFFPESFLLRAIGRISFPLFAWLIANGAYHTKNINKYIFRLSIFAIVSQIPYALALQAVNIVPMTLNIFFTLTIGLIAIAIIRKVNSKILLFLVAVSSAILATLLNTDYGGFGVLSIIAFYVYFKRRYALIISQIIIYSLMSWYFLSLGNTLGMIQLVGLLALIPIAYYNEKKGVAMKYVFYLVYPLHYVIIYFVLMLT